VTQKAPADSCVHTHTSPELRSAPDAALTSPKSRILFKNRFSKSVGSTSVKGFFSETISGSGSGEKSPGQTDSCQDTLVLTRQGTLAHFQSAAARALLSLLPQLSRGKSCLLLDREFLPFAHAGLALADPPPSLCGLLTGSSSRLRFSFLLVYFPPE